MDTQIQFELESSNASPAQKLLSLSLPHLHDRAEFPYNLRMPNAFHGRGALCTEALRRAVDQPFWVTVALWYTCCAQETNAPARHGSHQQMHLNQDPLVD